MHRASATQQKCRKIQAPKGLREMAPGRTANVNSLLVFTGSKWPSHSKTHYKITNFEGGLPPRRAGQVAGRRSGAAQAGAGGRGEAQIPRGGPARTADVHFLLVFTSQNGPTIQKPIVKSPILRAGATPSRGHGGNLPRGRGGTPPAGARGQPPRGGEGAPPRGGARALCPPPNGCRAEDHDPDPVA